MIVVVPDGVEWRCLLPQLRAQLAPSALRAASRVVYLRQCRGAQTLNLAAASVRRGLAFRAVGVDCADLFPHLGTLQCVVNVLRRGE